MRTIVIEKMTVEEKLELIDELWASLGAESIHLTPAQIEELDRRLAEDDRDDQPGEPWDEVMTRLRQRAR
jgi:putative addiction module component (TIGR02574 family)